jgi:DNA-binding GntR family transcriptional regulator
MTVESGQKDFDFNSLKSLPERKPLGPLVYDELKNAIVKGDMTPGSRVIESRVAAAMGISRTPVREAIHKLEREGLLRYNPKGGYFVAGMTREEIKETFGIRSILESYAAKLAAIQYQGDELKPLEKKIDEFQHYLDRGQTDELLRINTEFHDLLYALSRSPRLIKMIHDLKDEIFRFRQVILKKDEMAVISNEDHKLMLELIRERNADGVEKIVREHILRGLEVVLKELETKVYGEM